MANQEHLSVVTSGPETFAAWRERNPDTALELEGADLSQADLQGCKIRKADLRGANLSYANLFRASLA